MVGDEPANANVRAFLRGLRDVGLVDRRNIIIERRSAEGQLERLPGLMQEMVRLGVDVIVTVGTPGVTAAQSATVRIPIVALVENVVDVGLIESLARPGRNLTGIGTDNPGMGGKQLQLLKEAAPAVKRVAIIGYRASNRLHAASRVATEAAARALNLELLWIGVDAPEDFEPGFAAIVRERVDALYALGTVVNFKHASRIADFALKRRLPSTGFAAAGMLMDYGADIDEGFPRAAVYVKQILDGAKPADLPFEQLNKYLLVINLKTAKALGLKVPASLLMRADQVIQ
jgi:putative ABC transport system substrate-binding protein